MILRVRTEALFPARARRPGRIALAHDWLCGYRGGEAVLEQLAQLVESHAEPAGLFTMFDDARPLTPTIDRWRVRGLIHASAINRVPMAARRLRRWLMPAYPLAIEDLSSRLAREHKRSPIDLLISTSSSAVKGLRAPPGVAHLCYCFSPARYVWAKPDEFEDRSMKGLLRSGGLRLLASGFREWDRETASNVDHFVAISSVVRQRIREAFQRESAIVFPPERIGAFCQGQVAGAEVARGSHWLVAGALEPYKRVDLAIRAAVLAGARLVVVGAGSQERVLRRLAAEARTPDGHAADIEFAGRVGDEALRECYRRAGLLIFPQEEDFGIVAVEALACGLPVLARRAGGALDIIDDGVTGVFFDEPDPQAIVHAAGRAPRPTRATREACIASAKRFSESRFKMEMLDQIRAVLGVGLATFDEKEGHMQ